MRISHHHAVVGSCVLMATLALVLALLNLALAEPSRAITFLVPTVALAALAVVFHESEHRRP